MRDDAHRGALPHPAKDLVPARRRRRHTNREAYLFVAPALVLFALFLFYPVFENARIAFFDWNALGRPQGFAGLDNFAHVLSDSYFWNAAGHTMIFAFTTVPIGIVIAYVFAIWLNNPRLRGRHVLRTLIFIPVVTSTAILGIVVSVLLNPVTGPVNAGLVDWGIAEEPVDLLGSPDLALWIVIVVAIWQGLGVGLVVISAGLQSIEPELYEAAEMDGATGMRRHWHITTPLMRPVLATVFLLSMLGAVAVFDLVFTLTNGGPAFASDVMGTYVFRNAFGQGVGSSPKLGYAAAAGLLMSLMILALTALYLGIRRASARRKGEA